MCYRYEPTGDAGWDDQGEAVINITRVKLVIRWDDPS